MEHELLIRLLPFACIFAIMAILEYRFPRRPLDQAKSTRWLGNISLVVLDTIVARFMFTLLGATTIAMAWWVQDHGWGLLPLLHLPTLVTVITAIVLLDLVVYWQHRVFHRVPWLWRLHQVHHADRNLDVSSGLRFHPLEIILSLLIKLAALILLGAPPWAVLLFEVILNGMAMFNHANVKLPLRLDALLRYLVMTPDAHRIHHSVLVEETNSNYGFNISAWDRFFGSYRQHPQAGQDDMTIGLPEYQQAPTERLGWMLLLPWKH
ncbi:MAG: sterol desaturase family protein [Mariprofundaceae bacterium]|nr:sterol desaturase family protein [Mariprofundaceae bacterium]